MPCQGSQRDSWLRLTPEPERVLPGVVAALRSNDASPTSHATDAERHRIEDLVLHGTATTWLAYLHDVAQLAQRGAALPNLQEAARTAAEVVRDHHRLLIGVSEPLAAGVKDERAAMEQLAQHLTASPSARTP